MKTYKKSITVFSIVFLVIFFHSSFNTEKLPKANEKVLEYINSVMGTTVGTGECSDLIFNAQYLLKKEGISSKTKTRKTLPGDFISFKGVIFKGKQSGTKNFTDHHAIVFDVITPDIFVIAHQNHNKKRIVDTLTLYMNEKIQGSVDIRHP